MVEDIPYAPQLWGFEDHLIYENENGDESLIDSSSHPQLLAKLIEVCSLYFSEQQVEE